MKQNTIYAEISASQFSTTAIPEKPNVLGNGTPIDFLKERYSSPFFFGVDNLHKSGQYKIAGWAFDFRPFLKRYLVKQYDSWQEYFAPNKTTLRTSISGTIQRIVESD